jgi:dCMP deaminase
MTIKLRTIPNWDEYFLTITNAVSKRSSCLRRQIGAIAVKDKRILSTGYNGAPSGIKSCVEKNFCMRDELNIKSGTQHNNCMAIHAEENLIIQAALHGISLKGCTIYCTTQPCSMCLRKIISLKPERLLYLESYPDENSLKLLNEVALLNKIDECLFDNIYQWRFYR